MALWPSIGSLCALGGRAFYAFLVSVFALLGMVGVMGYFALDTVRTQALPIHVPRSALPHREAPAQMEAARAENNCPRGTHLVRTAAGWVCRAAVAPGQG